jgi:O-antigen ligase
VFWAAFSVFGALLAASRTRNAYVAFIGFVLIGFVYGRRLPVRKLFLLVVIIALSVALADVLSPTVDYLVRERDSIDTMSDRLPLWEHVTAVVMRESPLIGMGYYAASRIVAPQYNPGLGNTHSTFFEILVGGGIIGAVLYVLLCAILVWFAVRLLLLAPGEPMAVATAGLLFVALAMGITTPASVQPGPLGFAFWSTTALLPRLWREAYATRGGGRQLRFVPSVARSVGAGRLTAMNRHVR